MSNYLVLGINRSLVHQDHYANYNFHFPDGRSRLRDPDSGQHALAARGLLARVDPHLLRGNVAEDDERRSHRHPAPASHPRVQEHVHPVLGPVHVAGQRRRRRALQRQNPNPAPGRTGDVQAPEEEEEQRHERVPPFAFASKGNFGVLRRSMSRTVQRCSIVHAFLISYFSFYTFPSGNNLLYF